MTPTASDTCTLRDPARPGRQLCDQRSSYFRIDGLCHYHGQVADGKCGTSPFGSEPGLRGGVRKFPGGNAWDALFDGEVHPVPPNVGDSFRRSACKAATQRNLQFRSWTENGQVYLQAHPRQAVAS